MPVILAATTTLTGNNIAFTTPRKVYKGYRRYTLPATSLLVSITAMKGKINYKGLPKSRQAYEQANSTRILDCLDLHFPQGNGIFSHNLGIFGCERLNLATM